MHACRHPWIMLMLAMSLSAMGCRGSKPLGGLVRVTKEPTIDSAAVEPVPQRLATARMTSNPDAKSDVKSGKVIADASRMVQQQARTEKRQTPAVTDQANSELASRDRSAQRPRSQTIGTLVADPANSSNTLGAAEQSQLLTSERAAARKAAADALMAANRGVSREITMAASRESRSQRAAKPNVDTTAKTAKPEQLAADVKVTPRASTDNELDPDHAADAFATSPPEVQAQAIRRLVSAVAKSADKTVQPNPLNSALALSLHELPELPAARNIQSAVPPRRIATSSPAASALQPQEQREPETQVASISDGMDVVDVADLSPVTLDNDAAAAADMQTTQRMVQPLTLPDGLESTVALTGAAESEVDEQLRSVSATSRDDGKVARAVGSPASQRTRKLEIPLPPLSLATPPPSEDLAAIDSIKLTTETNTDSSPTREQANSPTPVNPEFLSDQELYEVLLARLTKPGVDESEAERSRRLIMARHLMVLAGNPEQATEKLEGLGQQEQKYLRYQLAGLWKMIDPKGHPVAGRRFSSALPELREATKYLAAATDSLEVRSLSFCTEIEAYGQVTTFPGNRFEAGQQVILYCEVDNFSVAKVEDGFETHLQGSYDVYNAENEKVMTQLLPADRQVASKYLRDYFIAYQMHLPKQLSRGTYRLQLTMEDVNGKKYGQASIPFQIAAKE